ncbi:MAG: hypothetical protein RID07_16635, partial [Lacipirellulaceae bacterium]
QAFSPRFCRFAIVPEDANSLPGIKPLETAFPHKSDNGGSGTMDRESEDATSGERGGESSIVGSSDQKTKENPDTGPSNRKSVAADLFGIKRPPR